MQAVRNQGGTVELIGINTGSNPRTIVFRGGPGSMASTAQDFCYARCKLKGKTFEIHLDVEYVGQSSARHEIDVSVYDCESASIVRSTGRLPRTNKPLIMAFECKFYESTPGVALARTFVGLISDCASNKLHGFICNKTTDEIDAFLSKSSSPEPFTDLIPGNNKSEERFVRFLEQVLRKWAATR